MNAHERQAALDSARRGDAAALGALLESLRPYVRVLVRGLDAERLQARLDESDLIQDALLEAHQEFPHFRGASPPELTAWLRQIVLRTVSHALRAHLGAERRGVSPPVTAPPAG